MKTSDNIKKVLSGALESEMRFIYIYFNTSIKRLKN